MDWIRITKLAGKIRGENKALANIIGQADLVEILKRAARIAYQNGYEQCREDLENEEENTVDGINAGMKKMREI